LSPELSNNKPNLESLNSISRALKPAYWNLDSSDFDVSPELLKYSNPERFAANLYDLPKPNNRLSLPYYSDNIDPREQKIIYVAVTPNEYNVMLRAMSPAHLANTALSKTVASKPMDNVDSRTKAGLRAGIYALDNKLEAMENYRDITITNDLRILDRLLEATEHPGLARGKEMRMRSDMGWVMSHMLEDMFIALKNQKDWDGSQLELARKVTYSRIFFEGSNSERNNYFKDLMMVNRSWMLRKRALIDQRTNSIHRFKND
jgi:hypothetical protein